jgi:hypothetical protein
VTVWLLFFAMKDRTILTTAAAMVSAVSQAAAVMEHMYYTVEIHLQAVNISIIIIVTFDHI